jgi:hypothetical protein
VPAVKLEGAWLRSDFVSVRGDPAKSESSKAGILAVAGVGYQSKKVIESFTEAEMLLEMWSVVTMDERTLRVLGEDLYISQRPSAGSDSLTPWIPSSFAELF